MFGFYFFSKFQILAKYSSFERGLNAVDENGKSPLCYSVLDARAQNVKLLLEAGCSTGPYRFGPLVALVPSCKVSLDLLK